MSKASRFGNFLAKYTGSRITRVICDENSEYAYVVSDRPLNLQKLSDDLNTTIQPDTKKQYDGYGYRFYKPEK